LTLINDIVNVNKRYRLYEGFDVLSDIAYAKRMGRPPLNVVATVVRLREGVAEKIDALVGKRKRAEFIRDAVDEKLHREEKKRSKP
jgi:hypothetical protein